MAIQCKVFQTSSGDVNTLERQINSWLLSQNSMIERGVILNTNQSSASLVNNVVVTTITIFYELIKK